MTPIVSTVEQKILEPLKFGVAKAFPDTYLAESVDVDFITNTVVDSIIVSLTARVMVEKLDEHTKTLKFNFTFDIPCSWWDDFKARRMPAWYTRRYPVQYKSVTRYRSRSVSFKKYAKYPNLRPLPRDHEFWPVYESILEAEYQSEDE